MITRITHPKRVAMVAIYLFAVLNLLALSNHCWATDPVLTGRATVKLNQVGTTDVDIKFQTKTMFYTALKAQSTNFTLLARSIGMDGKSWVDQVDLDGKFIDQNNEIRLSYQTPGAARVVRNGRWVFSLGDDAQYQLVTSTDTKVTLMCVEETEIGIGTLIMDVELPEGATDVSFDNRKNQISYQYVPEIEEGSSPRLDVDIDHKEVLMSCLAKCYGNRSFNNMWAARAVVKNTGDQTLNNYRVRFRVAEMGSWSGWQRTARVYPGQTVIDPFFPIFDLDKVMAINGTRPAVIEVEYQYEEGDGEKVVETDSFPIQMLSRNQVVFSSFEMDEITGYHDMFDYGPALMAAFTTPGDPVIQQLAGRVSGIAAEAVGHPIAAGDSDEHCVIFLKAMWAFINANKIAYQTPPGFMTQEKFGQHIKYGRDVLRNRAGTCVDLAITWASVCEAVGLDPTIVLVPGHAYPAVRLPQTGRLIALESTAVGSSFDTGLEAGMKNLQKLENTPHYLVDIKEQRQIGIVPLDLPNVSQDYLEKLNYKFNLVQAQSTNRSNGADAQHNQVLYQGRNVDPRNFVPNGAHVSARSLAGTWYGSVKADGIVEEVYLQMNGNGRFAVTYRYNYPNGYYEEETFRGTWSKRGGELVFVCQGEEFTNAFRLESGLLYFEATDNPIIVCMKPVRR